MAKKKGHSSTNPATVLVIALVLLMLSVLGIQMPDILFEPTTNQSSTINEKKTTTNYKNSGPIENGAANFTIEELKDNDTGWITYHPLDHLGRATGADALLKPSMVGTGSSANKDIRPPGFISGKANHSRGHLIGRQLGGSGDDAKNLTTLYQNPVNTPFMTKYENQIRKQLDEGETVRYRVIPIYEESNLLCKEIRLEAKGLSDNSTIDFDVTIPNEE